MTTSVLCAIDISEPEVEAKVLKMAKRLADLDGAALDIVTVIPDFGASIVGSFFEDDHVAKAQDAAKAALESQVSQALGAEAASAARKIVATGSVYEEILNVAAVARTDLIVIGAHKPDFKDYLLGPNASRVVRHSQCSVHVVR